MCGMVSAVLSRGKSGAALPHGRGPAAAPGHAARVLKMLMQCRGMLTACMYECCVPYVSSVIA